MCSVWRRLYRVGEREDEDGGKHHCPRLLRIRPTRQQGVSKRSRGLAIPQPQIKDEKSRTRRVVPVLLRDLAKLSSIARAMLAPATPQPNVPPTDMSSPKYCRTSKRSGDSGEWTAKRFCAPVLWSGVRKEVLIARRASPRCYPPGSPLAHPSLDTHTPGRTHVLEPRHLHIVNVIVISADCMLMRWRRCHTELDVTALEWLPGRSSSSNLNHPSCGNGTG